MEIEIQIKWIKCRLSFKHMFNVEQKKFTLRMIFRVVKDSALSWKAKKGK